MTSVRLTFAAALVLLLGCEKAAPTFTVQGSPIRYQTKQFDDPETLAEANGRKFTKQQILSRSSVIIDLDAQEDEAMIGLAYLRVLERLADVNEVGTIEIFRRDPGVPLDRILARFDRQPHKTLDVTYTEKSEADLVAKFRNIEVRGGEIGTDHVVMRLLEERRFEETGAQVSGQISRVLLSEYAAAQGQEFQALLKNEVFREKENIPDDELWAYLSSINFDRRELTDALKTRYIESLQAQKQQRLIQEYVAKNVLKSPVLVSFGPPVRMLKLSRDWRPVAGFSDAPVSLVAFSGTGCPDCVGFISALRAVVNRYNGHLKLNWIHNFSESDGIARMMANAALCISGSAPNRFLDFLEHFSQTNSQVDDNKIYDWARTKSLSADAIKNCLLSSSNAGLVSQHLSYARSVGIVANPTLWAEGRTIQGAISEKQIDEMVKAAIEAKGSTWWRAWWRRIKAFLNISVD